MEKLFSRETDWKNSLVVRIAPEGEFCRWAIIGNSLIWRPRVFVNPIDFWEMEVQSLLNIWTIIFEQCLWPVCSHHVDQRVLPLFGNKLDLIFYYETLFFRKTVKLLAIRNFLLSSTFNLSIMQQLWIYAFSTKLASLYSTSVGLE